MPTEQAKLLELAEQCEAASGGSRELDEAIERATGNYTAFAHYTLGDNDFDEYVPTRYTASIDAAMSLVPEGDWALSVSATACLATIPAGASLGDAVHGYATTPALALTAACLRARATENTDAPDA